MQTLLDAAGDGRLEDVKEHIEIGMDVNGRDWVSNYAYPNSNICHVYYDTYLMCKLHIACMCV